jgi:hypothetical protein
VENTKEKMLLEGRSQESEDPGGIETQLHSTGQAKLGQHESISHRPLAHLRRASLEARRTQRENTWTGLTPVKYGTQVHFTEQARIDRIEILAQNADRPQKKWTSGDKLVHLLLRPTRCLCCRVGSPGKGL